MDFGLLNVTLLLAVIPEAALKWTKLCKLEHKSNCRWYGSNRLRCDISTLYCNKVIECDDSTTISIIKVNYGVNLYVDFDHCQHVCDGAFWYSHSFTSSLMYLCNGKQVCELSQWNVYNYWKLHVNYDCKVKHRTEATSTLVPTKRSQPPQTTTSSNGTSTVTEPETEEDNAPDHIPVIIVAASVTAGIIVLVIVLIVVVCIKRRRRTIKSNQPDETTLQMQIVANISYGCSPPSVNMEDQQEADGHAYVDIYLPNATHTVNGTSEQKCVYLDAEKVLNKDINDEYNTLNTHPAPIKIDPNYDHIPKGSHTTVDETYSHVTGGETTMPDATYSHLKYTKSAASRNAKSNQNKSDNVYNHINTKSVEENVYNNSQTRFNRSSLSHLGETKAEEDDDDHTHWKQTKTGNSKSKSSNNVAVKKNETKNITERARDEYAVVKKRTDNVESSDGHNYFVLEKQFY